MVEDGTNRALSESLDFVCDGMITDREDQSICTVATFQPKRRIVVGRERAYGNCWRGITIRLGP